MNYVQDDRVKEGQKAYFNNLKETDCPYQNFSPDFMSWHAGFRQAAHWDATDDERCYEFNNK